MRICTKFVCYFVVPLLWTQERPRSASVSISWLSRVHLARNAQLSPPRQEDIYLSLLLLLLLPSFSLLEYERHILASRKQGKNTFRRSNSLQ